MINTFSLEQLSGTRNLDANLKLPQHELDLMTRFMKINSTNPRLRQDELAKQLSYSTLSLLRYRQELNMISPCRSSLNTH